MLLWRELVIGNNSRIRLPRIDTSMLIFSLVYVVSDDYITSMTRERSQERKFS